MRPPGKTRPITFGFILAIGITMTLPHFAFGAARSFGGSGRLKAAKIHRQPSFLRPFHSFDSSRRFRAPGFDRKDFFHPLSGALDLLVASSSTRSQSSLFSSFSPRQSLNLKNLPQTEFTFSRVGWTAGMEWKSYSPDTGQT